MLFNTVKASLFINALIALVSGGAAVYLIIDQPWFWRPAMLNAAGAFLWGLINFFHSRSLLKSGKIRPWVTAFNFLTLGGLLALGNLNWLLLFPVFQLILAGFRATKVQGDFSKLLGRSAAWALVMLALVCGGAWGLGQLALEKSAPLLKARGLVIDEGWLAVLPGVNVVMAGNLSVADTSGNNLIKVDRLKLRPQIENLQNFGGEISLKGLSWQGSAAKGYLAALKGRSRYSLTDRRLKLDGFHIEQAKTRLPGEQKAELKFQELNLAHLNFKAPSGRSPEEIIAALLNELEVNALSIDGLIFSAPDKETLDIRHLAWSQINKGADFSTSLMLKVAALGKLPQAGQTKARLIDKAAETVNLPLKVQDESIFKDDTYDLHFKASGPWGKADNSEALAMIETTVALPKILGVVISGQSPGPADDPEFFLEKLRAAQDDPLKFITSLGFNQLNLKVEDRGFLVQSVLSLALVKLIKDALDHPQEYPKYASAAFVVMGAVMVVQAGKAVDKDPIPLAGINIDGQGETLYPFSPEFARDLAYGKLKTDVKISEGMAEEGRKHGFDLDSLKPELLKHLN